MSNSFEKPVGAGHEHMSELQRIIIERGIGEVFRKSPPEVPPLRPVLGIDMLRQMYESTSLGSFRGSNRFYYSTPSLRHSNLSGAAPDFTVIDEI